MTPYIVFMPDGKERVEDGFPHHETLIPNQLWAIGTELLTCADVCEKLGIEAGSSGVVVKFDEYYGRWDRSLWDKIEAWGD